MKLLYQNSPKAILITILAFSSFAVSDALRKFMSESYEVIDILFWQAVMNIVSLLLILPLAGGFKSLIDSPNISLHLLRGFLMAVNTCFSLRVLSEIPIIDVYTIFFLTPFVIGALGVVFFKETMMGHRLYTIVIGFIGVVIAFRPGFVDLNPAYLYAVICVIMFSFSAILMRYIGKSNGLLSFSFWPAICLLIGVFIYKGGKIDIPNDLEFYLYMFVVGVVYALGMLGIAYSYNIAPAAVVAPCQYVQVFSAIIFDYLFWDSLPDIYKIIGMTIIIASGAYLLTRERVRV